MPLDKNYYLVVNEDANGKSEIMLFCQAFDVIGIDLSSIDAYV